MIDKETEIIEEQIQDREEKQEESKQMYVIL